MRNHSEHWKHWFGNLEILQLEEIVCMPVWENVSLLSLSSNTRLPACWVLEIQNFRRAWKLENDDFSGESSQTKKCPQFVCETGDMCCSGTYETQRYDGTSFCQEFPVQSTIKFHHPIWLSLIAWAMRGNLDRMDCCLWHSVQRYLWWEFGKLWYKKYWKNAKNYEIISDLICISSHPLWVNSGSPCCQNLIYTWVSIHRMHYE